MLQEGLGLGLGPGPRVRRPPVLRQPVPVQGLRQRSRGDGDGDGHYRGIAGARAHAGPGADPHADLRDALDPCYANSSSPAGFPVEMPGSLAYPVAVQDSRQRFRQTNQGVLPDNLDPRDRHDCRDHYYPRVSHADHHHHHHQRDNDHPTMQAVGVQGLRPEVLLRCPRGLRRLRLLLLVTPGKARGRRQNRLRVLARGLGRHCLLARNGVTGAWVPASIVKKAASSSRRQEIAVFETGVSGASSGRPRRHTFGYSHNVDRIQSKQ